MLPSHPPVVMPSICPLDDTALLAEAERLLSIFRQMPDVREAVCPGGTDDAMVSRGHHCVQQLRHALQSVRVRRTGLQAATLSRTHAWERFHAARLAPHLRVARSVFDDPDVRDALHLDALLPTRFPEWLSSARQFYTMLDRHPEWMRRLDDDRWMPSDPTQALAEIDDLRRLDVQRTYIRTAFRIAVRRRIRARTALTRWCNRWRTALDDVRTRRPDLRARIDAANAPGSSPPTAS